MKKYEKYYKTMPLVLNCLSEFFFHKTFRPIIIGIPVARNSEKAVT